MKPTLHTLLFVFMVWLFTWGYAEADFRIRLNTLNFSEHHNDKKGGYNEVHNGIGLSLIDEDGWGYGFMRFRNSFGDMASTLYVSKEFWQVGDIHIGAGGGIVHGYNDLKPPLGAWFTARYKWVVIGHIPLTVTSIGLSIPIK